MKKHVLALSIAAAFGAAGCASTWQPYSDDSVGQLANATYTACMSRKLMQTVNAETQCIGQARRAVFASQRAKTTNAPRGQQ